MPKPGVPCRPTEVRAAAFFNLRDVRGDVQGPRGDDEVLRIVSLVGSRGNAPGTILLRALAFTLTFHPMDNLQPLNILQPMVCLGV